MAQIAPMIRMLMVIAVDIRSPSNSFVPPGAAFQLFGKRIPGR